MSSAVGFAPPVAATPFEVPSGLVDFKPRKRSFVLLNGREKPVSTMYIGNLMTVPAASQVSSYKDGPTGRIGYRSAFDADNDPIPGSYLVEDVYETVEGEEFLVFDAVKAVCHILGLKPGSDGVAAVATSPYAINGLSLVRPGPSKAEWAEIKKVANQRAFLADVQHAHELMNHIQEVNSKRKSMDLSPVPPYGPEIDRARWVIAKHEELMGLVSGSTLPGQSSAPAPSPVQTRAQPQPEPLSLDEEIELEAVIKAKAEEIATTLAAKHNLDKGQLFLQLINDPKVRQLAQRQGYQIRKRGNQALDPEKLQSAIDSGLSVQEAGLEDAPRVPPGPLDTESK